MLDINPLWYYAFPAAVVVNVVAYSYLIHCENKAKAEAKAVKAMLKWASMQPPDGVNLPQDYTFVPFGTMKGHVDE